MDEIKCEKAKFLFKNSRLLNRCFSSKIDNYHISELILNLLLQETDLEEIEEYQILKMFISENQEYCVQTMFDDPTNMLAIIISRINIIPSKENMEKVATVYSYFPYIQEEAKSRQKVKTA